ncbi:MAG: ABC transporter ATP-binding protein [Chloroflexi bacterium]|nr:ABC transporter ATP-binding protein [Chloroflexota bacterium]OJV91885.1 MAG: sugar ABC transporter ATP-binding protein [Chloroflexi bacterium 54-19]
MQVQPARSVQITTHGPVIRVSDLNKSFKVYHGRKGFLGTITNFFSNDYKLVEAVKNISFEVGRGEILGYLGPNGAGKSTSIKMLTGILTPSSGEVRVNGLNPQSNRRENARQIGVVFGQRTQLWWDLPLIDSFELLRHIYKVPADRYRRNLDTFRELLDLDSFINTPVRQLSLGQRMRGDIAAALMHNPVILFLDEPTIGLDVVAKERLRNFIRAINKEQDVTILLTTHDMSDIEQLCKRLIIIDKGSLIYDGGLDQIRRLYGKYRTLVVDLESDTFANNVPLEVPDAVEIKGEGPRRWLQFNREAISAAALIGQVAARYPLQDLSIEEPEIEAIIRQIYEEGFDAKRAG